MYAHTAYEDMIDDTNITREQRLKWKHMYLTGSSKEQIIEGVGLFDHNQYCRLYQVLRRSDDSELKITDEDLVTSKKARRKKNGRSKPKKKSKKKGEGTQRYRWNQSNKPGGIDHNRKLIHLVCGAKYILGERLGDKNAELEMCHYDNIAKAFAGQRRTGLSVKAKFKRWADWLNEDDARLPKGYAELFDVNRDQDIGPIEDQWNVKFDDIVQQEEMKDAGA